MPPQMTLTGLKSHIGSLPWSNGLKNTAYVACLNTQNVGLVFVGFVDLISLRAIVIHGRL